LHFIKSILPTRFHLGPPNRLCPAMANHSNIYDLFDGTSLQRWERLVREGQIPSKEQLAEIIEANSDKPLPIWFVEVVAKSLRGELRQRPGRPKQSALSQFCFAVAEIRYHQILSWLKKREQSCGLKGWAILQKTDWWQGPPHERAAKIVTARWLRHISWKSFLNRVSSQQ